MLVDLNKHFKTKTESYGFKEETIKIHEILIHIPVIINVNGERDR